MRLGPHPTSRLEAERMIAAARVMLASTSLLAIWLDPAEPARFTNATYALHMGYVVYSLIVAVSMRRRSIGYTFALVTHSSDVMVFSVFQYLTLGPSSPFFVYFIFSLFCGAIRWGWRGTFGTAIIVSIAYIVMGVSMSRTLGASEFELNRFIIRIAYLAVTAGLLVYLGQYQARLSGEIERLARWPAASGADIRDVIERVSEHAARIVGAGRALVVWEAEDEPSINVVSWSSLGTSMTRHAPDELIPLVTGGADAAAFLRTGAATDAGGILVDADGGLVESDELGIHPALSSRLNGAGLAAAAFKTNRVSGWVFFTDIRAATPEIIPLAEVVAREIGASLDQLHVTRQLQEIAASEERIRVARDLHDGVLQSLTGIRLELRSMAVSLNGESTVRDRLFAIERALAIEQRELRFFIGDLSPAPIGEGEAARAEPTLSSRLELLRERIAAEWKVPVTIRVAHDLASLPLRITDAIPPMVHEAVVNALKHGQPSRVIVAVQPEPGGLRIIVSDDGHGFPFRGLYDHAELTRTNTAPLSLLERITALGGEMSIESTDTGSRVEMRLTV
jgi:signal transduction histidine kinase